MANISPGVTTFVTEQNPSVSENNPDSKEPSSVLPGDKHKRQIDNFSLSFNVPSPDNNDYRTKPRDRAPAKDHPQKDVQPYPEKIPRAAHDIAAYERQESYRGNLERYQKKYYRKNKTKLNTRADKFYDRNKNKPSFKRKKDLYKKYPQRHKRKPNGPSSFKERDMEVDKTARQHKQRGQDKLKAHRYYLRHRNEIKRKVQKRYNRVKRTPAFKRVQHLRHKHPERFRRLTASVGLPCFFNKYGFVQVLDVSPDLCVYLDNGSYIEWFDFLSEYIPYTEEDLSLLFEYLDTVFESTPKTASDLSRVSDILERDPDAKHDVDRASPRLKELEPGIDTSLGYQVWDNPGSSKVIPENKGFINTKASKQTTIKSLLSKSNKKTLGIQASLSTDKDGLRQYRIKGSTGHYKASVYRGGGEVRVACTCPSWVFSGAEYRAFKGGYLFGKPKGNLAPPDPKKKDVLCKHLQLCLTKEVNRDA